MTGKTKVEIVPEGVLKYILKDANTLSYLEEIGRGFAADCGQGYGVSAYNKGKARCNVAVYTATDQAEADNLKNNTLLKVTGC